VTWFPRDKILELLHNRTDLTLAEAFEALQVPYGLVQADLNPEDWFIVGHRIGMLGSRLATAARFNHVGIQTNTPAVRPGLIIVQQAIVAIGTTGVLRMATNSGLLHPSVAVTRTRDGQRGTLQTDTGISISVDDDNVAELGTAVGQLDLVAGTPVTFGGGDRDPVAILSNGPKGDISESITWNPRTLAFACGCHVRFREFDLAAR
jgi:hypothetical protein